MRFSERVILSPMDVRFVLGENLKLGKHGLVAVHIDGVVGLKVVPDLDNLILVKSVGFRRNSVDITQTLNASGIFDAQSNVPTELGDISPELFIPLCRRR